MKIMNKNLSVLDSLKTELTEKPSRRAVARIISQYVSEIKGCVNYGYTLKDIYEYIFSEADKEIISLKYFQTSIINRARKFNLKNQDGKIKESDIHAESDNKASENPFNKLVNKWQKDATRHQNGSSMEDVHRRLEALLEKRNRGE